MRSSCINMLMFVMAHCLAYPAAARARGNFLRPPPAPLDPTLRQSLNPFVELCRIAEEIRADAVVVGASARTAHRLVGSLAVRLVKAGRWPVTVVP
jgi:nucleotide-binding universal stress UspA family protein